MAESNLSPLADESVATGALMPLVSLRKHFKISLCIFIAISLLGIPFAWSSHNGCVVAAQPSTRIIPVPPLVWAQAQAVYGKRNWSPQRLTGTGPGYLATRDWEDLEETIC